MNFKKSAENNSNLIPVDIFKYLLIVVILFLPCSLFAAQFDHGGGNRTFYIPKGGDYSIRAYLKHNRGFMPDEAVNSAVKTTHMVSMDSISGWDISPKPSTYDNKPAVIINESGLRVDAKEDVVMTKEFSNVSLKENPYMSLSYDVQDSDVPDVIVYIWFKDRNNIALPESLMLKPAGKIYFANLYKESLKIFNKEDIDRLYIAKVSIICKRKKGMDASNAGIKSNYTFTIKGIAFLKYEPILVDFADLLPDLQPARYYYYDKDRNQKGARFFDEIPDYVKSIYSLERQRFVNLKDKPVLTFRFSKPDAQGDLKGAILPAEFKVVLILDFNGDGKKDAQMEMIVLPILKDSKLFVNMPVYEKAKKMFPDKKDYNLLGLSVSYLNEGMGFYQEVESGKFIRYEEYRYGMSDLKIKSDVMTIDGSIHESSLDYKKHEKDNYTVVEFNGIRFSEGYHTIEFKDGEGFKVAVIEIKPMNSGQMTVNGQRPRLIEFKKINPTRYVVDVKGANESFTLVFSETFHEGWKAYIRQNLDQGQRNEPRLALWSAWKDRGEISDIKDHFIVNGYANGWIVPIEKWSGIKGQWSDKGQDFQIVLEYKPQRIFEAGVIISASALFGCIGYLGYEAVRRGKKEIANA